MKSFFGSAYLRAAAAVTNIGLISGAIYLPITLQLMLGGGPNRHISQAITLYFFPLCWSAFGLGFIPRVAGSAVPFSVRVGGLFTCFLILSLSLPIQINSQPLYILRIVGCGVAAALIYYNLGLELNRHLSTAGAKVPFYYGLFLSGIIAGGIIVDQTVPLLGGNAIILLLAIAIALTRIRLWLPLVLGPILATAMIYWDADLRLERMRNVGIDNKGPAKTHEQAKRITSGYLNNYSSAFDELAWNRRGQTFFYRDEPDNHVIGVMNLMPAHRLPLQDDITPARFIHAQFKQGERILLIGVGSGRSLQSISKEALGKNILAIERDQNTVRLLSKNQLNPHLNKVNFIAADGRGFIEQSAGLWDWIFLESALDQVNLSAFQMLQPMSLYTKEALNSYLDRLDDSGTLVIEIKRANGRRMNIANAVMTHLDSLGKSGVQTLYAQSLTLDTFWGIARKNGPPLEDLLSSQISDLKLIKPVPAQCAEFFSDTLPFIDWMCLKGRHKLGLLFATLLALLGFLLFAEIGRRRLLPSDPQTPSLSYGFLTQSIAHCFIFLTISYRLKSTFGDEVATIYVFSLAVNALGALTSFYVYFFSPSARSISWKTVVCCLLLSLIWLDWSLSFPIINDESPLIRFAALMLAISPTYLASNYLFQLTLRLAQTSHTAVLKAFLFDSIAILPAYLLVPWLLFELGTRTLFLSSIAFYALSVFCLYLALRAGIAVAQPCKR